MLAIYSSVHVRYGIHIYTHYKYISLSRNHPKLFPTKTTVCFQDRSKSIGPGGGVSIYICICVNIYIYLFILISIFIFIFNVYIYTYHQNHRLSQVLPSFSPFSPFKPSNDSPRYFFGERIYHDHEKFIVPVPTVNQVGLEKPFIIPKYSDTNFSNNHENQSSCQYIINHARYFFGHPVISWFITPLTIDISTTNPTSL